MSETSPYLAAAAAAETPLRWPGREPYEAQRQTVLANLKRALAADALTNGAQVETLEAAIAARCGARHCVALASATLGLVLALRALLGERRGAVAAPVFSFNATVLAPIWNGRRVLCLPVDPNHFNLCADALAAAIEGREVAAVIAIGVAGNLSGLSSIGQVARRAGIPFLLDAAPCLGARAGGLTLSRMADAAVLSLSSRKVLPAGEGGLVLTDSDELAGRLRRMRLYGSKNGFYCIEQGLNARMSELHAATALGCLEGLDQVLHRRRAWAQSLLDDLSGLDCVAGQKVEAGVQPAWNDVIFRVPVEKRDAIISALLTRGVQAVPFYHPLIYRHEAFSAACDLHLQGREPAMDELSRSVIGIPVLSVLDTSHREAVATVFHRHLPA